MLPEVGAEGRQHVLMGFKADALHHQHTVTQQTLDTLILQLLQHEHTVTAHTVHLHTHTSVTETAHTVHLRRHTPLRHAQLCVCVLINPIHHCHKIKPLFILYNNNNNNI